VPDFDEVPVEPLDDPDELFESDVALFESPDVFAFLSEPESEPEPESVPPLAPVSEEVLFALLRDLAESELSVL
jgi:hypothetical protein